MIVQNARPIATVDKLRADRRAIFVSLENETDEINLLVAQQNERFGQLRCIYIDTSAQDSNGDGCTITTDLGQNITALNGTQGYYPVFLPFISAIKVSSNQTVNLLLLDFDMQPATWITTSGKVPDPLHVIVDGQPLTTNATIENWPPLQPVTINGQPIATTAAATQSGPWSVGVNNFPIATVLNAGGAASAGNRIIVPNTTPINLKFFQFSSNNAQTSVSDCIVQFFDGAGNLLATRDLTASTNFLFNIFWAINLSLNIVGLNYTLSNSLASGGISYVVVY